jgi:transcriptional regulator
MYCPPAFREERPEVLYEIIRAHSFGTLVSHVEGELFASHVPFLLDADRGPHGTLLAHVARANPQWQAFGGEGVLAIFQGPHAYVSPSWYETELSVPTWNYAVVHARGVPRLLDDAGLQSVIERLVETYEASLSPRWSMARLPAEFVERLSRAIVGFEIEITRLDGKLKMSQNRPAADREGAAAGLQRLGNAEAEAVAAWIDRLGAA